MGKVGIFPRTVSHDEALTAAQNFINAHFRNPEGRGVLTSIPACADDDDLILVDYIKQRREHAAKITSVLHLMADVIDKADRLIERGYGIDTPAEWHEAIATVSKARRDLMT